MGIAVPAALLGTARVRRVLLLAREIGPRLLDVLLLLGPPLAAAAGGWLPWGELNVGLVAAAVRFVVMNGTCEVLL